MRSVVLLWGAILLIAATGAMADDNALGLYFSDTEFTQETATAEIEPDFLLASYVVLTGATGSTVAGYEVMISCTAPDFSIPVTSLFWGENAGTSTNQIVHFATPVPVVAGGTVLSMALVGTASTGYEEISFGPADPSSLPGTPVVDFGDGDLQPCSYPFGTPVVAWLNADPVATEARSYSGVKRLFD